MNARDPEPTENERGRQEHPQLDLVVKPGTVVNALDPVRTPFGGAEDVSGLRVELYLPTVRATYLQHAASRTDIQSIDVIPSLDLGLWDLPSCRQDLFPAENELLTGASASRGLHPVPILLELQDDSGSEDDRNRYEGDQCTDAVPATTLLGEAHEPWRIGGRKGKVKRYRAGFHGSGPSSFARKNRASTSSYQR